MFSLLRAKGQEFHSIPSTLPVSDDRTQAQCVQTELELYFDHFTNSEIRDRQDRDPNLAKFDRLPGNGLPSVIDGDPSIDRKPWLASGFDV